MDEELRRRFSDSFLWGVAASSYQIEGAVEEGGRGRSIWDEFSHIPGNVAGGHTGDRSIDHYHRYRDDVALMADLGLDAYRFSIAWPRLLPEGTGEVNPRGVDFYRRLAEELRSAGIVPLATLYHWDLPQALQDRGGWLNPASVEWFADYARVAVEQLGDLIDFWITHNEPWCAAFLGYSAGHFAPGVADPASGFVAAHHIMLSHHRAVADMRRAAAGSDARIGIALNLIPARPATSSESDVAVARTADAIHNGQFLEAALHGRYPDEILRLHERFGVTGRIDATELAAARADSDFLGVNYYNINRFIHDPESPGLGEFPGADGAVLARPPGELTEMGWGVEPAGLTDVLRWAATEAPDLPLYVTENGAAYADEVAADGTVDDRDRIDYLRAHIAAIAAAREGGVDVRGYFAWSIFDNFEWALGYTKRFGLVRVDYETLERTVKASGHWYRDFMMSTRS